METATSKNGLCRVDRDESIHRRGCLSPLVALVEEGTTRSRLARLERAIEAWRASRGAPPPTLEELVNAGLADRSYLVDPRRRPFHYEPGEKGYVLSAVDERGQRRPDATLDRRGGR